MPRGEGLLMRILHPRSLTLAALAASALAVAPLTGQSTFHSTQGANLQTTAMLNQGNFLFEISHRFLPAISDGSSHLWGFDGPVFNRLGFAYQATDRVLIGVLRTNLDDNLEVNAKIDVGELSDAGLPVRFGLMGGIAWNTDLFEVDDPVAGALQEDNEMQLYAQLLANVLLGDRVAVGVVPTFIRNPRTLDRTAENGVAVGIHGQAYVSDGFSFLGEWIFSESRPGLEHDSGTFGIEIETRGHFFKIVVTNQARMNPTQFLGGTPFPFEADELRVGFNLTRLLPF